METVEWKVRGRFSLREAIGFGFGYTEASAGDVMRLAFVLDGYDEHAGVAVTQPAGLPQGEPPPDLPLHRRHDAGR
jgi:hypothetical protein